MPPKNKKKGNSHVISKNQKDAVVKTSVNTRRSGETLYCKDADTPVESISVKKTEDFDQAN